jgi:competence protein ComEC
VTVAAPWRVALCAGAFATGVALSPRAVFAALLVALGTCVAICAVFADRRVATSSAAVVACLLGIWRGVSAATVDTGPGSVNGHLGSGAIVLRGTVGDAGVPGREDTIVVEVHQLATQSGSWKVSGAVVVEPRTAAAVLPGDTVDVQTTNLRAPPQRPGSLSGAALERVGVTAIATAAQVTPILAGGPTPARIAEQARQILSATVVRALPEPEATLLLGVAFGIHGRLTADVRRPLQNAGLIHIVAVSGLKVVMVAALVNAATRVRGWPRGRRRLATLAVIALYVMLSGAGAAAVRSSVMVGAGLLLTRDGRRPHSFAMLSLCAALLLAIEPAVATDVGFQLSFLGTAGILLLASPIAARIRGPRLLVEPFAVTVAAQLATAPVTAGTFGVLSLVGPFANALALPLLPPVIVVGGAGALVGTIAPALGWLPLELAAAATRVTLAIAEGAASLPLAAIQVQLWPAAWTVVELAAAGTGVLAWFLQARWRRPGMAALALAAIAAVTAGAVSTYAAAAATGRSLRITVLDVGNGVAVLIRPPAGGTVLVDGGSDGAALLTALGRVLSPLDRHLDAIVLTATDRASSAAVSSLIGRYDVGGVVISQPLPPALQTVIGSMVGAGTQVVVAGTAPWTLGGVMVRCLTSGPAASAPCALQVSDGESTALITGNLAQAAQDELAGMETSHLRADLVVGPTTTAASSALLAAALPTLVAVPAKRTPPALGATGLEIAVTGRDSDLEYDGLAAGGFASPIG